jgi:hypothetical protein
LSIVDYVVRVIGCYGDIFKTRIWDLVLSKFSTLASRGKLGYVRCSPTGSECIELEGLAVEINRGGTTCASTKEEECIPSYSSRISI